MIEVQKLFILDDLEFICLLSYVGIDKAYGFKVSGIQENLKKSIHYAVYSLCKKGYMRCDKDIFLDDEIKRCLCIIQHSEKALSIKRQDNNEQSIVYISNEYNDIVIVRQSLTREKDIIMCSIHKEDLYEYWVDEGYLLYGKCVELLEDGDMEEYIEVRDENKRLNISMLILRDEDNSYISIKDVAVYDNFLTDCTRNRKYILSRRNMYMLLDMKQ